MNCSNCPKWGCQGKNLKTEECVFEKYDTYTSNRVQQERHKIR